MLNSSVAEIITTKQVLSAAVIGEPKNAPSKNALQTIAEAFTKMRTYKSSESFSKSESAHTHM